MAPKRGETFSQFLDRVLEIRGVSVNELGRRLAEDDGIGEKSAIRKVRRWTSRQKSISAEAAADLDALLVADFSRFIHHPSEQVPDLLTQVLARLDALERRLDKLER